MKESKNGKESLVRKNIKKTKEKNTEQNKAKKIKEHKKTGNEKGLNSQENEEKKKTQKVAKNDNIKSSNEDKKRKEGKKNIIELKLEKNTKARDYMKSKENKTNDLNNKENKKDGLASKNNKSDDIKKKKATNDRQVKNNDELNDDEQIKVRNNSKMRFKTHNNGVKNNSAINSKNKQPDNTELIIFNLSHKETEETIKSKFTEFGTIIFVQLIMNKQNVFSGKAKIKFQGKVNNEIFNKEIILNNKILKILKPLKKEIETEPSNKRVFINHMNKSFKIIDVRKVLREIKEVKPVDIRVKNEGFKMRNPGYCFVEFKEENQAQWFIDHFDEFKNKFGEFSKVEFSNEKVKHIKNK